MCCVLFIFFFFIHLGLHCADGTFLSILFLWYFEFENQIRDYIICKISDFFFFSMISFFVCLRFREVFIQRRCIYAVKWKIKFVSGALLLYNDTQWTIRMILKRQFSKWTQKWNWFSLGERQKCLFSLLTNESAHSTRGSVFISREEKILIFRKWRVYATINLEQLIAFGFSRSEFVDDKCGEIKEKTEITKRNWFGTTNQIAFVGDEMWEK